MGRYTHFYGKLEFTRQLRDVELYILDVILNANLFRSEGFIVGPGLEPGHASDLTISNDKRGIVYCCEKTNDIIAGLNFIITNARERIPGFGLKGTPFADTEFEPYIWLVRINKAGFAEQDPNCRMTNLLPHSPRAYLKHLRLNWRHPSVW